MDMSTDAPDSQQEPHVQVSFVTRLEARLRVTEAPILLPTRLRRSGLSQVINHLLEGTVPPRPFDFMLGNELLRGTVADGLLRHGLTGESTVKIEYMECVPPPQPGPTQPHEDWVAALAAHPDRRGVVLSGCYDHQAYVWDAAGRSATLRGHMGPVKAVTWLAGDGGDGGALRAATGSKDQTLRLWRVAASGAGEATVSADAVLVGHTSSVEAVVANPAGDRLCSGAWDGSVLLWPAGEHELGFGAEAAAGASDEAEVPPPRKKRPRGAASADSAGGGGGGGKATAAEVSPDAVWSGTHGDCVGALCWPTAGIVYSGSWDGSLREWQVEAGTPSATLGGQAAVLSVDVSLSSGLIASGHTDHLVRVWDARLQQSAPQISLPHPGWVCGARWCTQQPHLISTACYDGSVRLWDVRSTIPLHEVTRHQGKALCITWDGHDRLVSGGSDSKLQRTLLTLPDSTVQL